ncbi:MAG: DUF1036 domain-containing protein [Bdellovibrionales bacterium]
MAFRIFLLTAALFIRHFTQLTGYVVNDSPTVFHALMFFFRFMFLSAVLCGFLCMPRPAWAAFLFCNQTKSVIEAAFGHHDEGKWVSEGWWQLQPGQCARVYNKPLTQRFYFYYARALTLPSKDGNGTMTWSGKYAFCVDSKAFRAEGDSHCEERGFKTQGFQDVDVGIRQKNYTLTFQDAGG